MPTFLNVITDPYLSIPCNNLPKPTNFNPESYFIGINLDIMAIGSPSFLQLMIPFFSNSLPVQSPEIQFILLNCPSYAFGSYSIIHLKTVISIGIHVCKISLIILLGLYYKSFSLYFTPNSWYNF